jgi:quercetin dioxygenase-like cupin family protein
MLNAVAVHDHFRRKALFEPEARSRTAEVTSSRARRARVASSSLTGAGVERTGRIRVDDDQSGFVIVSTPSRRYAPGPGWTEWKESTMSLPQGSGGYGLAPGEGEALWFNGGFALLKATSDLTGGRFAALELRAPKGFASPLHIHRAEDEFFIVLEGEVRLRHGDDVIEAVAGSFVYGPRDVPHAFRVDSDEARLLLFFGPAGVERFFREAGKPAASHGLPPAGELFLDKEALKEIGARYSQEFVGPPLPPRD